MAELLHGRVDRVHLVLVELRLQWGEVEEPVPEPADEEGGDHVPQEDVRHPASRELGSGAECRVDKSKLSCYVKTNTIYKVREERVDCVDLADSRWRGRPGSRTSRRPPWQSGCQSGPGKDQLRVWEVCPQHL